MHGSNSSSLSPTPQPNLHVAHHMPPREDAPTPDQRLSGWTAQLGRIALREPTTTLAFLDNVAHGRVVPGDAALAQAVFNELICLEAYGLFVEVFDAYNELQAADAKFNGHEFKSTLTLRLPEGWKPTAPHKMVEAFGRIAVQKLNVMYPEPVKDLVAQAHQTLVRLYNDALSSLRRSAGPLGHRFELAAESHPRSVPVPEAACLCVATLLKAGTAELVVHGALADPAAVAQAIAGSTTLVGIELGEDIDESQVSSAELAGYSRLVLEGMSGCATLKEVSLHHRHVVMDLPRALKIAKPCLPALTSLSVTFGLQSGLELWSDFLEPLKGHVNLTSLNIKLCDFNVFDVGHVDALQKAGEFCITCPSLKHFKCDGGPLSQTAEHVIQSIKSWYDQLAVERRDGTVFSNAAFKLESFTMIGFALEPDTLNWFFSSLALNQWLKYLDLSGGAMEIKATKVLMNALLVNTVLRNIKLPEKAEMYYLAIRRSFEGAIYGLRQRIPVSNSSSNSSSSSSSTSGGYAGIPDDFELFNTKPIFNDVFTADKANFERDLKKHADTIVTAPQELLNDRQRQVFQNAALADLGQGVAALMTTAAEARGVSAIPPEIAAKITEMLDDDRALRTVVHLSEVNTAIDHHNLRDAPKGPPKTPQHPHVKTLVKVDNRDAVKRGLASAPLSVNEVDARHANVALMAAVLADDVARVRELLEDLKAIDFGGQARQEALSDAMRELFRRHS